MGAARRGLDPGESDADGLRRELAEELVLDDFELGPLLWRRELRWWTADDLRRSREVFGPRRLPELIAELLESGAPSVPLELGK
ncbi:MAG TPA: hypothetical protein VLD13_05300 [Gaiellaceae bacterium]|nr:hypothetical protein [Gaiellaceae bacterium]